MDDEARWREEVKNARVEIFSNDRRRNMVAMIKDEQYKKILQGEKDECSKRN